MIWQQRVLLLTAALFVAGHDHAVAITIFTNSAAYNAARPPGNYEFEDFESYPVTAATSSLSIAGFRFSNSLGNNTVRLTDLPDTASSGVRSVSLDNPGLATHLWEFDIPVKSVSFNLTDLGDSSPGFFPVSDLFVQINEGAPVLLFDNFAGGNGNVIFLGIVGSEAVPISSIRFDVDWSSGGGASLTTRLESTTSAISPSRNRLRCCWSCSACCSRSR